MAFHSMRFRRGATTIEYGILAALIVILAIFAIMTT
jgi:Flp pilus assembly pilin Flp